MNNAKRAFDTPHLERGQPLAWLKSGWADLKANARISLTYGALFTAISWLIVFKLKAFGASWAILPAIAGFTILGPIVAMGLYEISRRHHAGLPITFKNALLVKTREPVQVAFMGAVLLFLFMIWLRVAALLYAIFFSKLGFPGFTESITLLFSVNGLAMAMVGSIFGAIFATTAFTLAAYSLPAFLTQSYDVFSAAIRSAAVIRYNPAVSLTWGLTITALVILGVATNFLGFIIIFPLLGHATWHAYQDTVAKQTEPTPITDEGATA